MSKKEAVAQYGEEQVDVWMKSFDLSPPPMEPDNPYYSSIVDDPRYVGSLAKEAFPQSESLKATMDRTLLFWNDFIAPHILSGKRVIIVAHASSLLAIMNHLEQIPNAEIPRLEIPTGNPLVYTTDVSLRPLKPFEYLLAVKPSTDSEADKAKVGIHRRGEDLARKRSRKEGKDRKISQTSDKDEDGGKKTRKASKKSRRKKSRHEVNDEDNQKKRKGDKKSRKKSRREPKEETGRKSHQNDDKDGENRKRSRSEEKEKDRKISDGDDKDVDAENGKRKDRKKSRRKEKDRKEQRRSTPDREI
jgi:hypothetical protein